MTQVSQCWEGAEIWGRGGAFSTNPDVLRLAAVHQLTLQHFQALRGQRDRTLQHLETHSKQGVKHRGGFVTHCVRLPASGCGMQCEVRESYKSVLHEKGQILMLGKGKHQKERACVCSGKQAAEQRHSTRRCSVASHDALQ